MAKEPTLCPDCPLPWKWKKEALKHIKQRQYIKVEQPSALKICIERRKIIGELGFPPCPHFNYGFYFGKTEHSSSEE
jgi:hypothetical protein